MQFSTDPATLRAALIGYQQQLDFVNSQIEKIRRILAGKGASPVLGEPSSSPQRKHHVSAEGRARIAAAQRRRWAAARKSARGGK